MLLIIAPASIVLSVIGCGGSSRTDIFSVATSPWPEGPVGPVAAAKPVPGIYVPLAEVKDALPLTLPENPKQHCREGATVVITLKSGRSRTYGPCARPASIELLRLALVRAAERTHPLPRSTRAVTGRQWKSLINDWYDGHIDGWYRCAVVREAITHLPSSPPLFSTVLLDFRSYAKAVCPTETDSPRRVASQPQ
jgi:hypothetical protein